MKTPARNLPAELEILMRVLLLTDDLMAHSQVAAAVPPGVALQVAPSVDRLLELAETPADLVLLDLGSGGLDPGSLLPRLRNLTAPPSRCVAFGPHVREELLQSALRAGCDEVLPRGRFFREIGRLLASD